MRCRRRWAPRARIAAAGCAWCSAAAVTAIPASVRSWVRSRPSSRTTSSSPTTIRAPNLPRAIAAGIGAGIPAGKPFRVELDRARAIRDAIDEAREDDVVVVAGKGHEDYQIYGAGTPAVQRPEGRAGRARRAARAVPHEPDAELVSRRSAVANSSARIAPTPACPATRARSSRANCSSRCAGRASTPTSSWPPPKRLAPRAPWWTHASTGRSRRSWSATRSRLCRNPRPPGVRSSRLPVIGVAGSNGKTTCKEMTAAILQRARATRCTRAVRCNNHIGVPLTLHRLEAATPLRRHRDRAPIIPAKWLRSARSRGRQSASSPTPAPSTWKASAPSKAPRAPRAR